jgi:glycyl-tRNA synthetase
VLSLPPLVAPTKVLIVPLSAKDEFDPLIQEVCKLCAASAEGLASLLLSLASKFRKAGVFSRVDDSNTSIGKRYARNDELGTPFGVTLDFACTYKNPFIFTVHNVLNTYISAVANRTMTLR